MRTVLILAIASLCATPTFADKAQDTAALTSAGLVGSKWALDCTQPSSESNYHLSYTVGANGIPVESLITAGTAKDRELRNVQLISSDWLLYTLADQDGEAVNILTSFKGDRKKSWWSVGKDGTAYILDGKFTDSGEPPWFEKCE